MAPRFLTLLTGHDLPKIDQTPEAARARKPSSINDKTAADFTHVVEQTGILDRERCTLGPGRNPD